MNSEKKLTDDFSFMSYVPFVFISAKTGLRINKLFEMIKYVAQQNSVRIPTEDLMTCWHMRLPESSRRRIRADV